MVARAERRHCPTSNPPPYAASAARTRAPSTAARRRTCMRTRCSGDATCCAAGDQGQVDVPRLDRGQRRAPGPGRIDEGAASREPRAERRSQRRRHLLAIARRLAAARPGAACSRGPLHLASRAAAIVRGSDPGRFSLDPLTRRPGDVPRTAAGRPRDHRRPAVDRGRACARGRPRQRRRRGRSRVTG